MQIILTINHEEKRLDCQPGDSLLRVLRKAGYFSVKYGSDYGDTGASAVLVDGRLTNADVMLAAQAEGHSIETVESLATGITLHPIQDAFVRTGAIQCGYCTPAMILATKALLEKNPNPTEEAAREALSGILCRCTGYVKPVQAVLEAAAVIRGEKPTEIDVNVVEPLTFMPDSGDNGNGDIAPPAPTGPAPAGGDGGGVQTQVRQRLPKFIYAPKDKVPQMERVGKPDVKVDALKLVKGNPAFVDDYSYEMRGMLHAKLLTSPHAHARILSIDDREARNLPGVHAVIHYFNTPRVKYASGGQTYPNPRPYDQVSFDNKVRYVGDRVAAVAAETLEIAEQAIQLIQVEYEVLPAVFDAEEAMKEGAPIIHDEIDAADIYDAEHNVSHFIDAHVGNVDKALEEADHVFEMQYEVHQVHATPIETHIAVSWWDSDERLTIRSSTQVPFHTRRMLAPLIGLPVRRIRIIKPRIGGGFGVKQEMLIEDIVAHLTIVTGKPVRMELNREEEFISSRTRHPQKITYKSGVNSDGKLVALDMKIIGNTGAYAAHGLTVQTVSGLRGLSTYNCENLRFACHVVYTNIPVPGAYRGYGAPQALFALETHMEEVAHALGMDVVEFKQKNYVRSGDPIRIAPHLGEGEADNVAEVPLIESCGLDECMAQGMAAMDWEKRYDENWRPDPERPYIRRGLGMAVCMHGTAIPGLDMGGASIKINDDGSFNVLVGATDLGTGSDTILAQIAAEVLGVPTDDIIMYSSDTDMTPFDTGAYASSTTYISGTAVKNAAEKVREQILERAALILGLDTAEGLYLKDKKAHTPDGRSVTLEKIALHSLHQENQQQIMGTASYVSPASPPPFAAQFAEVEVDIETGQVTVKKLLMAVDAGVVINPITASGQIEGGMTQALGYGHSEEMVYDKQGRMKNPYFGAYKIYEAHEMPELEVILVQTFEPTGPFGAKALAEIPKDGVAPALSSAIFNAIGIRLRSLPFTPEKVWQALQASQ